MSSPTTPPTPARPVSVFDYERRAAEQLPRASHDFIAGGSGDEVALRRNREALERIALRPRVLRGVGVPDPSIELLGRRHPIPVVIGPTAFTCLAHADGELAVARAAAAAGVTQTLSVLATRSIEDVARTAAGPRWLQLFVFRERALTEALVRRAEEAGYEAIVLTVDAPVMGRREADVRNGFALPAGMFPENLMDAEARRAAAAGEPLSLAKVFLARVDPAGTWEHVDWLRSLTRLPVLVKGVVRGDDAEEAVAHGVAGIVASNHGGRQLDCAPAGIDALSEVAAAVAGRVPVLMDSGIRRGADILKALARGASGVLIARPVMWALAVAGEDGVRHVLELLGAELAEAMALCGCRSVREVGPDLLG